MTPKLFNLWLDLPCIATGRRVGRTVGLEFEQGAPGKTSGDDGRFPSREPGLRGRVRHEDYVLPVWQCHVHPEPAAERAARSWQEHSQNRPARRCQVARTQETVAVLGIGAMGHGMAAGALRAGIPTILWNLGAEGALDRARIS